MAIKLDEARVRSLKITQNSAFPAISFGRAGWNYIISRKGGTFAFCPGSAEAEGGCSGPAARLAINYDAVIPGQNNGIIDLGSSSYKWKNVYATTFIGNLDGNATSATKDDGGNIIKNTYLKLSGGTMTGNLVIDKTGTTNTAKLIVKNDSGEIGLLADTQRRGIWDYTSGKWVLKAEPGETSWTFNGGAVILTTAANTNMGFKEDRTGGSSVAFGVGTGNVNHGVYSNTLGKWIVYADDSKIYLNGNALTATTLATTRSFKISGTAGTTGTDFNGSADATLIIPTTVKAFAELGTKKLSSPSGEMLYISSSATLYLDSGSGSSLIFRPQGTEKARFNTSGEFSIQTHMYPGTSNTYDLGISNYRWKNVYATNYYGEAQTLAYGQAFPNGDTSKIWYEIATFTQQISSSNQINTKLVLYISNYYNTEKSGILEITARQEANTTAPSWIKLNFITASEKINLKDFVATWKYDSSTTTTTIKLYVKQSGWTSLNATKIAEHRWGGHQNIWVLNKLISGGVAEIPTDETQIAATISDNISSKILLTDSTASIGYTQIISKNTTANNTTIYLPASSGYLLYKSGTAAVGSSSVPVYIQATGEAKVIDDINLEVTDTKSRSIRVTNANGSVGIHAATNQGLYNFAQSSWIIYSPKGTTSIYIPAWADIGSAYVPTYHGANGVPIAVTANNVIVNLASTAGDSIFAASPRPGVTGTLPVANGGTGNTLMTANRLVWSESDSKIIASNHFVSNEKVAIASTTEPEETFFVNGSTRLGHTSVITYQLPGITGPEIGWYRIAQISGISGYLNCLVLISGSYSSVIPSHVLLHIAGMRNNPIIKQIAGQKGWITSARITGEKGTYYFEIYLNTATTGKWSTTTFQFIGNVKLLETYAPTSPDGAESTYTSTASLRTIKDTTTFAIADNSATNTGTEVTYNGSSNITLKLPATIKASLTGNATSATKATQDSDGKVIKNTYLKLAGGTMTGNLTLPAGADAYSNASLFFGKLTRIGASTSNNNFGIYSTGKIMLRPNNGTMGYSHGVELSTTSLIPTKNNTVVFGDTSHYWKEIYATHIISNNLSSASENALHISSATTLYLDSGSASSIVFKPQGTEKARFNTSGEFSIQTHMYPGTNNTYTLGTSSFRWKTIYGISSYYNTIDVGSTTGIGDISVRAAGDGVTINQYARLYVAEVGKVGTGTNTVPGSAQLTLGNSIASSTDTTAGLNNAYGILRIYGTGSTYQQLRATNGASSRTSYLRDYGSTGYLVATTGTAAVGSTSTPVYVNSSGVIRACGDSLSVDITGNADTASSVAWSGITSKPSYYDAKAITSITRSGTTFTATYLDGSTFTFTQRDNNTTYAFINKDATLSWGTATTIATVGGTDITVKLPSNPNTNSAHAHAAGNGITLTGSGGTSGTTTIALSDSFTVSGTITANKVYGAVWNDYAEYRWVLNHPDTDEPIQAGRCVAENGNDSLSLTHDRLQPGAKIISDTYGMCMGETEKAKTPIAVCGRVLAYPFERKVTFNVGDPVCSGPNGTVSKMSREEAMMYPERIVGTVVSKPTYKEWGPNKIPVNGRIWIQVK